MLIGLAVLAVVVIAFYFLVLAPQQGAYTFEDGYFELSTMADNRGVSILTFTEFEGSDMDG